MEALAVLYDFHSAAVYSIAMRVLRDVTKAEMVLEEVFLSIWQKRKTLLRPSGSLRILLAIDALLRSKKILREYRGAETSDAAQSPQTSAANDTPDVLEMAVLRGMTMEEIAHSTGWTADRVKAHLASALRSRA